MFTALTSPSHSDGSRPESSGEKMHLVIVPIGTHTASRNVLASNISNAIETHGGIISHTGTVWSYEGRRMALWGFVAPDKAAREIKVRIAAHLWFWDMGDGVHSAKVAPLIADEEAASVVNGLDICATLSEDGAS